MKAKTTWTALVIGGVLALSTFAARSRGPEPPTLDEIKKLTGDWVALDENGEPEKELANSFRVTAGGTAVLDIEFPGTDKEMLTVYHQDGDDLVMTHYCMLGNQPHMKARWGDEAKRIVFECDRAGGSMASCEDKHMHRGELTWIDEDRVKSEWFMVEKGEVVYTATFDIVRKSE